MMSPMFLFGMQVLTFIITVIAVCLSFVRNKKFDWGHFLAALFLSPFYIIYHFVVPLETDKSMEEKRLNE